MSITIEKSYGIRGVANDMTLVRLQEVIALSKEQYGWVGKAVIDAEKITFYKFGLKLGLARHAVSGFSVDRDGIIKYVGFLVPIIHNHEVLRDVYKLFNKTCYI